MLLTALLYYMASTPKQRRMAVLGASIEGWKGVAGAFCAVVVMTGAGALFSANTLGFLVKIFPGENYSDYFEIVAAERFGSKYKSVVLDLKSVQTNEMRYLELSKKLFDYPAFQPGMKVLLEGKANWFGVYVEKCTIERTIEQ